MRFVRAFSFIASVSVAFFCAGVCARADEAAAPAPAAEPALPATVVQADKPAAASTMSPEELAALTKQLIKASQNPVGNIAIIPFQTNWNNGVGPQARGQFNLNLQPVVPIMLSPTLNLIARAIFPIINNPSPAPPAFCNATPYGCGSTFGTGDLTTQFFLAPKTKPDAMIWGIGPQFAFPSGTPSTLSSGKFSAGPAAVALIMPGSYVIGVLTTQLWSYAGDSTKPNVSSFLVQPFVNFNFGQAWAISTAPSITSNWTAAPGNRWTVPLGGGISKTFKLGDQPMQLGLFYYTNVVRPTNAPVNQFRFNWSLLFPVKRGASLPK